jgi:C-methyltransferase
VTTTDSATHAAPTGPDLLMGLSTSHLAARALYVVADAGVADALADPVDTATLAAAVGADPDVLERLLCLLETHGVFTRTAAGQWCHTPASRALRSDDPRSMRSFVQMVGSPLVWESFTALDHTLRTGQAGIHTLDPDGPWGYLQHHPAELAVFDAAMTDKARGDVAAVLAAYDFSPFRSIADIGGGRGHLITAIRAATPATTGVLFDLPAVASQVAPEAGLDVVAGDFFADPLPVCEAYLLMQVIHDWDDTDAHRILEAVARAGRSDGARVLLLEWVLPDTREPHPARTLDIMMLATTGGRERTLAEYSTLLEAAGIGLLGVHPTASPMTIIEGWVRPQR